MLRQRKLRDRLVAMAALPILLSAAAAAVMLLVIGGDDGRRFGLLVAAVAAFSVPWAIVVGWSILRSLSTLAIAAEGLADAQERVGSGEMEVSELPALAGAGRGREVERLAAAIDVVGRSAVDLADSERESIRKGLATIVINLARRNQSLLDRQVEYLDALEQSEEDPERLGELFRVDHLATRMRRNAESLLVLAGADPGKRKGKPVAVSDVLRVAIGEVENYQQIELGQIEEGRVPAGVAVDLAHLTAELMENATQFSPPSASVDVSSVLDTTAGLYRIRIRDRGMGLGDRLEQANATLADPPELGLGMGRSLGFMVVGRLAQRLRASVHLEANEGGGTIAEVRVPLDRLEGHRPPEPAERTPTAAPASRPGATAAPAADAASQQPVASTTLEKLLGIKAAPAGGEESAPGQTPATRPAEPASSQPLDLPPTPGPSVSAPIAAATSTAPIPSPGPAPAAASSPPDPFAPAADPTTELDWQQRSPFDPIDGTADSAGTPATAEAASDARPEPWSPTPTSSPAPAPPPAPASPAWMPPSMASPPAAAEPFTPPPPLTPEPAPPSIAENPLTPAESNPAPATPIGSNPVESWPDVAPSVPSASDPAVAPPPIGLPPTADAEPMVPQPNPNRATPAGGTPPGIADIDGLGDIHGLDGPGTGDEHPWPDSSIPTLPTGGPDPRSSPGDPASDPASTAASTAEPVPGDPNPMADWPPPVVPPSPPSRFDEAVPSGPAFEDGVASLLEPTGPAPSTEHPAPTAEPGPAEPQAPQAPVADWPPATPTQPGAGLQKRQRGASNVPIGEGRPVAAPSRSPEEVRDMLSRYRNGLKSGGRQGAGDRDQGSSAGSPTEDKDR